MVRDRERVCACMCICVLISTLIKPTVFNHVGSTLMISSNSNDISKVPPLNTIRNGLNFHRLNTNTMRIKFQHIKPWRTLEAHPNHSKLILYAMVPLSNMPAVVNVSEP
jgi:hypothetical protein